MTFPDIRRGNIQVQTPAGIAGQELERYPQLVTQEYLANNEMIVISNTVNLSLFSIIKDGAIDEVSVSDGDTLKVIGRLMTRSYGIDKPGLEAVARQKWEQAEGSQAGDANFDPLLDTNDDGVINFPDFIEIASNRYILNWEHIPSEAEISVVVYIREVTADIDRNNQVDFEDFISFAASFGASIESERYNACADLDGNGKIEFQDFIIFAQKFASGT